MENSEIISTDVKNNRNNCANDHKIDELLPIILKIGNTEIIFILGSKIIAEHTISAFAENSVRNYPSEHWLLILIDDDEKRHKIFQDQIEQKCADIIPVVCILTQFKTFFQRFKNGNRFARKVVEDCSIIYNKNKVVEEWKSLSGEIEPSSFTVDAPLNPGLFKEYLAGADLYTIRKQYRLAIFMFHQAAELLLTTFIEKQTSLQLHTHNINHLSNYLSFLYPTTAEQFRGTTAFEKECFRLLQKSYTAARYDADFTVSYKHLQIIQIKLKLLYKHFSRATT